MSPHESLNEVRALVTGWPEDPAEEEQLVERLRAGEPVACLLELREPDAFWECAFREGDRRLDCSPIEVVGLKLASCRLTAAQLQAVATAGYVGRIELDLSKSYLLDTTREGSDE